MTGQPGYNLSDKMAPYTDPAAVEKITKAAEDKAIAKLGNIDDLISGTDKPQSVADRVLSADIDYMLSEKGHADLGKAFVNAVKGKSSDNGTAYAAIVDMIQDTNVLGAFGERLISNLKDMYDAEAKAGKLNTDRVRTIMKNRANTYTLQVEPNHIAVNLEELQAGAFRYAPGLSVALKQYNIPETEPVSPGDVGARIGVLAQAANAANKATEGISARNR